MRTRGFAWLVLLLGSAVAGATQVAVDAPWQGWSAADERGEIRVRIPPSPVAGQSELLLQSAGQRIVSSVAVPRAAAAVVSVPVPTMAPLTLSARNPDGGLHHGHFEFQHSERPIFAWASMADDVSADSQIFLLHSAANDLPRLAAGYDSVAGVAIDDQTLQALDDAQALALLQHVRDCGFTLLLGVSDAATAALRQSAGCGGRQLIATAAGTTPADGLAAFLARDVPTPLGSAAFRALAPDGQRLAWLQAALLVYGTAGCAALLLMRRNGLLWALPLLATTALALTFYLAPPRQQAIVWAEARSGDAQARVEGRLRLRGMAPRQSEMRLPALIEQSHSCDAGASGTSRWDSRQQRTVSTSISLRLLATDDYCFRGNFPVSYRAAARREATGTLLLANSGAAGWHDARLLWQGKVFRSGTTPAAASLHIAQADGVSAVGAAERIGLQRLAWNEAGLLLPLQLSSLGADAHEAIGWLFLRVAVDAEASP